MKPKSELVGQSIRSLGFCSRFNAAVLAVKRNSERQLGRIGDIVLEAGDVLILLSGRRPLLHHSMHFLPLSGSTALE